MIVCTILEVVEINDDNINHLDFLFVRVGVQSKGIGQARWKICTPYFDKRNIHFYVNKLKFKIVEYYNEKHHDPNMPEDIYVEDDGMIEFEKVMTK